MATLPIAGPSITQREIDYVTDAVTRCWYGQAGEYHERFERAVAEYLGVRFAVALPSCTSAIHLSLAALGVGPGDEVIVPELTWIASSAPISYVGAQPVFADVDRHTWCLSAEAFEARITERIKAAVVVDLYGNMPDMDAVRDVAERRGIPLIEDAAEAFGSQYNGQKAGSFGVTGVFSLHGSKTVTTGEGGLLVTDREDLYRRVLVLRDHGRRPGDTNFFNDKVAFKYKMSAMQAALGLAQVERAEELVEAKRRIFGWYREELADVPGLTFNPEPPGTRNSYWMTTVLVDPTLNLTKDRILAEMARNGIDGRPMFHPLSSLPAYAYTPAARTARESNPVAYELSPRGVNLPSALCLTRDQVARAAGEFRRIIAGEG
ncbi:MAG: DegT/DnrJ/EryC1/StrS family aminotransferase [Pirellulales bacterium]|nr:DegT/DnrJ/EryC1/StrS family aminotransferase [Pirellulales bacterium]